MCTGCKTSTATPVLNIYVTGLRVWSAEEKENESFVIISDGCMNIWMIKPWDERWECFKTGLWAIEVIDKGREV